MQRHKIFRLLFFCALLSLTALLNAQSTGYIKKRDWEDGGFKGGVFIGLGAKATSLGTRVLAGGADGTTEVIWRDARGITQSNDTLTKTDSSRWGNAGALSNNQLKKLENGWITYRVNNLYKKLEFGLTNSDTAVFDSIKYAVRLDSSQIRVYNRGLLMGSFGTAAVNDSIRMERIGNVLFYTKNQIVFYNQQVNPKDSLRIDVALYTQGASFKILSSFGLENFSMNTIGMDTLETPDTLKYKIYGTAGISGIYKSNTSTVFYPKGITAGSKTITTSFYGYSGTDSAKVIFDINKFRKISNVRFKFNDTINPLDSSLFVIDKNGTLALLSGTKTYESQYSPLLNIVLDGGVSMTPNNDGQFDSLLIQSNVPVSSYYINVTSTTGDTLYTSTSISHAWKGKTVGGSLVPIGNYFYHITLNGKLTEGQFLVEY